MSFADRQNRFAEEGGQGEATAENPTDLSEIIQKWIGEQHPLRTEAAVLHGFCFVAHRNVVVLWKKANQLADRLKEMDLTVRTIKLVTENPGLVECEFDQKKLLKFTAERKEITIIDATAVDFFQAFGAVDMADDLLPGDPADYDLLLEDIRRASATPSSQEPIDEQDALSDSEPTYADLSIWCREETEGVENLNPGPVSCSSSQEALDSYDSGLGMSALSLSIDTHYHFQQPRSSAESDANFHQDSPQTNMMLTPVMESPRVPGIRGSSRRRTRSPSQHLSPIREDVGEPGEVDDVEEEIIFNPPVTSTPLKRREQRVKLEKKEFTPEMIPKKKRRIGQKKAKKKEDGVKIKEKKPRSKRATRRASLPPQRDEPEDQGPVDEDPEVPAEQDRQSPVTDRDGSVDRVEMARDPDFDFHFHFDAPDLMDVDQAPPIDDEHVLPHSRQRTPPNHEVLQNPDEESESLDVFMDIAHVDDIGEPSEAPPIDEMRHSRQRTPSNSDEVLKDPNQESESLDVFMDVLHVDLVGEQPQPINEEQHTRHITPLNYDEVLQNQTPEPSEESEVFDEIKQKVLNAINKSDEALISFSPLLLSICPQPNAKSAARGFMSILELAKTRQIAPPVQEEPFGAIMLSANPTNPPLPSSSS
ncbi:unnamed protein product [Caenorhabditis sp. 36 PRJEB53466]|nr:unnamed protein product [Caenorhabditis sp. 36 PRJEB53466]